MVRESNTLTHPANLLWPPHISHIWVLAIQPTLYGLIWSLGILPASYGLMRFSHPANLPLGHMNSSSSSGSRASKTFFSLFSCQHLFGSLVAWWIILLFFFPWGLHFLQFTAFSKKEYNFEEFFGYPRLQSCSRVQARLFLWWVLKCDNCLYTSCSFLFY